MKVVLDAPGFQPEIRERFPLSLDYEIEIDVPRLYRAVLESEPDPSDRHFWRGRSEPHISIRLASRRFEHPARPCQDFPRQRNAWQLGTSDGGAQCESDESSMIRRVVIIDDRAVLCEASAAGLMSATTAESLRAVCATMKVTRRRTK